MKNLIISVLLTIFSFTAFAQVGSQSVSGIKYRVNDTTTYQSAAATAHAQGYADIYYNNQATTKHWDIWNGSSYDHVFDFNAGSGAGLVDGDYGDITVGGTGTTMTIDNGAVTGVKLGATTSAQLATALSDETGTGTVVYSSELTSKLNSLSTYRTFTSSHTLDATDLSHVNSGRLLHIVLDAGSDAIITIPLNSSQAFPVGCRIKVSWIGSIQVSFAATGGVILNSANGWVKIAYQYASAWLEKTDTNTWLLQGTLAP